MARLPDPYPNLSDDARARFNDIEQKRGAIRGMYRTLFNHPDLAIRVSELGTFLRFGGILNSRDKEVAILTAARHLRAGFVWQQHLQPARVANTPQATIDAIKNSVAPPKDGTSDVDILAWQIASLTMDGVSIPTDLANEAKARAGVGIEGMIELVIIAGFYKMIAGVVTAFDVPLPDPSAPPFDDFS